MTLRLLLTGLLFVALTASAAEVLLKDDFSSSNLPQRRAARGDWTFANLIAVCTQDDELFKKNKDHGPILSYIVPLENGRVRFSCKAEGVKALVFTINGAGGHIFRFVQSATGTSVRAFPPESADHRAVVLGNEAPKLEDGQWQPVEVELQGNKATLKIGSFAKTYEHPALAHPKANVTIGFSFGTLAVRDVTIER